MRTNSNEVEGIYIRQRIAAGYCRIPDCGQIICSSIPEHLDPGTVASNFIDSVFKIDCKNAAIIKLSFNDCKFPENKLRRNWLRTNVSIDALTFRSCSLSEIEDDIFSESIYKSTKSIIMVSNRLDSLRRSTFRHLKALSDLTIQNNTIELAEFDLLADVADSLTILDLSAAINNRETLRNITGGSVPLSKLQILSIRENSVRIIDRQLFSAVPSVQSLYLDNSKVEKVARDTLEPMASSILQVFLNGNNITTLPEGLFDRVINSKRSFRMTAKDNPWHCNCSLKWMLDHVGHESSIMVGIPTCKTPEINAGKSFTKANFCYQSNSTSPAVTSGSTESTKHDWSPTTTRPTEPANINLTCNATFLYTGSRKLMSSDFLQIPARFPRFYVYRNLDGGIVANLPNLDEGVTLLWFDNHDVEGSLSCARNVKQSYLIQSIDPWATYTICLLVGNTTSPLNCLAASPVGESVAWLKNTDKGWVYGILVLLLILLFLVGAVAAFLMVRRHPTLLRGSKRVMLVKHRNLDVIVLPKGVDMSEEKSSVDQKSQEDGYITPLPPVPVPGPRRSRVSRISVQSDVHSYVSQIEPTDTQLDSWRLTRLNSEIEKRKCPPLPPHRKNAVSSLSSTAEPNEAYYLSTI
nr:PREDICTED: leucine-rich repeat transmembrane protein FLRT1-like [Megachile rotundata]